MTYDFTKLKNNLEDKGYDCNSPERICRNLSVLWSKPSGAEYEVILINEEMGY